MVTPSPLEAMFHAIDPSVKFVEGSPSEIWDWEKQYIDTTECQWDFPYLKCKKFTIDIKDFPQGRVTRISIQDGKGSRIFLLDRAYKQVSPYPPPSKKE
jgi:hypothetical protein